MMKDVKQKLTLDQPATYQIKVPGHLDERWSDWAGGMTITVESEGDSPPVTTLTGTVADQAALSIPWGCLYCPSTGWTPKNSKWSWAIRRKRNVFK